MKHISYITEGTCSRQIDFDIDDEGKIHNLRFFRGCPGNTSGISKLCEGREAGEVARILEGITCGDKPTSCPDQLARALRDCGACDDK